MNGYCLIGRAALEKSLRTDEAFRHKNLGPGWNSASALHWRLLLMTASAAAVLRQRFLGPIQLSNAGPRPPKRQFLPLDIVIVFVSASP
jgi:hypothetical protein